MDPMTAMMIAQTAMSVGERVYDEVGKRKAMKQLGRLQDPMYDIPQATLEGMSRAKSLGSSFMMPGQSNLEFGQDNILAGTVDNINNLSSSSSEGLQALVGAYGNRVKAQNQIGGMAANNYMDRQRDIYGQLDNLANAQDKQWEVNVNAPFQRHYANIMSTLAGYQKAIGADNSNIKGGVSGLAGQGAASGMFGGAKSTSMVPAFEMDNYYTPDGYYSESNDGKK